MNFFKLYLKSKFKILLLFLFFSVVVLSAVMLYGLPIEAALYPLTVCLIVGIIFLLTDFVRQKGKHKIFKEYMHSKSDFPSGLLPTDTVTENDYKELTELFINEIAEIQSKNFANYRDTVDYYTVWVHQIKTPIASMKLALQNEDTELSRRLFADALKIERYVEMVLVFLRLDSDSSDYVFKEYSLDRICRECVKKFSSEFISRKLSMEYKVCDRRIVTDEKWLSFVIEQIISNALKYTPQGTVKLYTEGENTLCIADSGIGIEKEDIPRIFDKGYTGYNGRTDKTASGLGLYLCKRICDNLGVDISVESKADVGTTVFLKFTAKNTKYE